MPTQPEFTAEQLDAARRLNMDPHTYDELSRLDLRRRTADDLRAALRRAQTRRQVLEEAEHALAVERAKTQLGSAA